jgi:hypothetical protein
MAKKKAAPKKAAAKPAAPKPIKEVLGKSGLVAHLSEATGVVAKDVRDPGRAGSRGAQLGQQEGRRRLHCRVC